MSLAKSSFIFTAGTFISRISGLVRETIIASVFGATGLLDAYLVANRIPNLFREMLAEGALGSAFTKVYSSLCVTDENAAQKLLIDAFRLGLILTIITSILGIIAAPWLVDLMTMFSSDSGRNAEFYHNTIGITRMMFPFLGISILAAIAMGVLQQRGEFFIVAVSPVLLNVGYIVGALVFAKWMTDHGPEWIEALIANRAITGLTIGVLLGGLAHFLAQFYFVWRDLLRGSKWRASKVLWSKEIKHVIRIMAPAAIASSAGTINLLVNTNFATSLEPGSVSWLNYAFRLLQLPVGLFAVAISAAVLPSLSRAIARAGKKVDSVATAELANGVDLILWLMVPCMIVLFIGRLPLIQLIFQHGKFDDYATQKTAEALGCYAFGVVAYGLIKVLTAFYFAVERTKFAMYVSLFSVAVNFAANWYLCQSMEHMGLAAATSVTLTFNAAILLLGLKQEQLVWPWKDTLISLLYLGVAAILALLAQSFCHSWLSGLDLGGLLHHKAGAVTAIIVDGTIVGGVFATVALLRLGWSPKYAIDRIKNFRKR